MSEGESQFSRNAIRPVTSRRFQSERELNTFSQKEQYAKHQPTNKHNKAMGECLKMAHNYFTTMRKRVEEEQPDYFEEKGTDLGKFETKFITEVCYEQIATWDQAYRNRDVEIESKGYLNDTIRKLVNGGDKFHPYL